MFWRRINLKGEHRSHTTGAPTRPQEMHGAQNLEKAAKKKLTQITGHLIEFYLQDGWHMTLNNFLGATSPSHHTAIVGHLSSFINTFNSRPQNAETTIRCSQWQQVTSLLFWLDSYLHRKGQKWLELQKRKHRIPRETPERVEQKIALIYIYNMGMKGGQLPTRPR